MSFINEVHEIGATLNNRRREAIERENKRALIEQYNNDLKNSLKVEFIHYFKKYDYKTAYKYAVAYKDEISEKVYKILYYAKDKLQNRIYKDFDIIGDIDELYYKILNIVKYEYIQIYEAKKDIIKKELYNYLYNQFKIAESKKAAYETLQKNDIINMIIEDVTYDDNGEEIARDIYITTLNEVKKQYNGDIIEEKQEQKNYIKQLKDKRKKKTIDNLTALYIIKNFILK